MYEMATYNVKVTQVTRMTVTVQVQTTDSYEASRMAMAMADAGEVDFSSASGKNFTEHHELEPGGAVKVK